MDKPIETIKLAHGVVIKVYQDPNAQSPEDWDNTDAYLGNPDGKRKLPFVSLGSPLARFAKAVEDKGKCFDYSEWRSFNVRVYEHSGFNLALNTGDLGYLHNDRFDSYDAGQVYIRKPACDNDEAKILAAARSVIEEWNTYLSGDVYGYVIEDAEGEQLDSCWGFYGLGHCIEEAKTAAEATMPVARGHALIRKLADDVQRMAITADDIERGQDRARVVTMRKAHDLVRGSTPDKMNADMSNLSALYSSRPEKERVKLIEDSYCFDLNYIAAMVYAAWRERYWPGD